MVIVGAQRLGLRTGSVKVVLTPPGVLRALLGVAGRATRSDPGVLQWALRSCSTLCGASVAAAAIFTTSPWRGPSPSALQALAAVGRRVLEAGHGTQAAATGHLVGCTWAGAAHALRSMGERTRSN